MAANNASIARLFSIIHSIYLVYSSAGRLQSQFIDMFFFVQLTPICNRSNVSSVQSIINEVREQGHAYFQTLSGSISVAISLNGLAQDVGHLADCLLDPACKPEEIRDFIAEMRGNTRDALEISKHISTAYRTVRTGINQVQLP
jgi:hypothetical protein